MKVIFYTILSLISLSTLFHLVGEWQIYHNFNLYLYVGITFMFPVAFGLFIMYDQRKNYQKTLTHLEQNFTSYLSTLDKENELLQQKDSGPIKKRKKKKYL